MFLSVLQPCASVLCFHLHKIPKLFGFINLFLMKHIHKQLSEKMNLIKLNRYLFTNKIFISMTFSGLLAGASGALGLYSGVKGLFDSDNAAREQKRLIAESKASEDAWYKRNYYGDYINSTMARAAMKRVERTLRNRNRLNRAYAAVNGATPELTIARNRDGLEAMENVMTSIAAQDSANKSRIDAMHRQNLASIRNKQIENLAFEEQARASAAVGGFNLLNNALMGVNWGKED